MTQQLLNLHLAPRTKLKKAQSKMWGSNWGLPKDLFGHMYERSQGFKVNDMIDFEMEDYIYFLDNIGTLPDLIKGLVVLSPFADDALHVAEWMSEKEFQQFKKNLPEYRKEAGSVEAIDKYSLLLLPEQFLSILLIADKAGVSLGVALIRQAEIFSKPQRKKRRKKQRLPRT